MVWVTIQTCRECPGGDLRYVFRKCGSAGSIEIPSASTHVWVYIYIHTHILFYVFLFCLHVVLVCLFAVSCTYVMCACMHEYSYVYVHLLWCEYNQTWVRYHTLRVLVLI